MDKKGILLAEETLKIIIAVISIAFLAYFLSALYFSKVNSEKLRFAENDLEVIDEIILSLEEGVSFEQNFPNPDGWYLFSFVDEVKPNSCAGKNCLCICGSALDYEGKFNMQQKKCDNKGSCLIVEDLREVPIKIKIQGVDDLLFVTIKKENGRILVEEK